MKKRMFVIAALAALCFTFSGRVSTVLDTAIVTVASPVYRKSENANIYYSGSCDPAFLQNAETGYNMLPERVRNAMVAKGTAYYLVTKQEAKAAGLPCVENALAAQLPTFTIYPSNNVNVTIPAIAIYTDKEQEVVKTVLHEAGHFVDSNTIHTKLNGYINVKSEVAIIDKYTTTLCAYGYRESYVCAMSTQERFAEAFRLYITDPYWLAVNCPELYQLISNCVAQI